ncbi:hypothetical protein [Lacicoccus alkaliphilus]|uniref:Phenylacetate-CoA ligase n=1 Tax=Lacicoccus alkaliphilus DSM 16010 TaxID=1123231 RepID=A0A1M7CTN5_9BACL|nr:hypothetical protein [Salinicoccus alkaliphilus]SHL70611.1 phenylacetate-CoA ligase [Salinicoccus alkaliphilus DSM 16010]
MLNKIKTVSAHDIYHASPVFMQHVFTSAYGYKLKRERYSSLYREALKNYIRGRADPQELLVHLMHHLKENIKVYENIEIDENDIMASFKRLPFTEKGDLRYALEDRSYKKGMIRESLTSGTTGANLIVYDSEHDRAKRMAFLDYIKYQNGVMPFSKRASFTGQELTLPDHNNKLWRFNYTMNQMLYAARYITPDNVSHIYESLERFRPVSMDGSPSALHILAKHMLRGDIKASWDVTAIFPTNEILTPRVKRDLEKAFDTIVIDQYSTAEGAPFIYSDPEGRYMLGDETGLFEFFRKGHHLYEMVVTTFINEATPIVRYKIGDQVEMASDAEYLNSFEDECRISKIIGRGADFLYSSDGNKVNSIIVAWIADELEDVVAHTQFIQEEMNRVTINIVVEEDFTEHHERTLRERTKKMLGREVDVIFNYMDAIPKARSGKVRFIINEVE